MRNIAVLKNCSEIEKNLILSAVEEDDNVMFFESENQLLRNANFDNIDIIFGEPEHTIIQTMKKTSMDSNVLGGSE